VRHLQGARGTSLNEQTRTPTDRGVADRPGWASRRVLLLGGVAVLVVALDAASKAAVVAHLSGRPPIRLLGGLVYLVHTRNTGAAFSIAEGQTMLLSLVALAVVIAIVRTARRLGSKAWAFSLGLILGGAMGNLADRLLRAPGPLRGAVVDWIDLRVWPVFNLADSALVLGVCLAVLLELQGRRIDGARAAKRRG
jgi:signal peptidase II